MERAKQITNDKKLDPLLDHIYRQALGVPIILKSVPTSASMKANTVGVYGSDVYIKHANGVLLKLTGAVIP